MEDAVLHLRELTKAPVRTSLGGASFMGGGPPTAQGART